MGLVMHPRYIKSCRVYGSPYLTEIIDLGDYARRFKAERRQP